MNARLPAAADNYLGAFRRIADALPGQQLAWLREAREAAIGRFACSGFPSQRDEDWKYTSVAAIEKCRFSMLPAVCPEFMADLVASHALPDAHLLVFVNGRLEPHLCRPGRLPAGVVLAGLGYRLEQNPDGLEQTLLQGDPADAFNNLNLAFMADGAYVRLPAGAAVKAPIQLLFIASEVNLASQPRNLVQAAEGSSAIVIEQHVGLGEITYLTNAVTDIALDSGASIEHYKLQQESAAAFHVAAVNVRQGAESRFVSGAFALGGRLARTAISVELDAPGAVCHLDGLYLTNGRQHIDYHTRIDHRQARCTSRQLYKGVLSGASRAVFNGRVVVHPDAQGSDAVQSNRNLLLSDNAEIDTKPQLEIWADDVKCSHGATVGQLDDAQVFYLCSRGIDRAAARTLLTRAFAREMIDRVHLLSLQEKLDALLLAKLEASPC